MMCKTTWRDVHFYSIYSLVLGVLAVASTISESSASVLDLNGLRRVKDLEGHVLSINCSDVGINSRIYLVDDLIIRELGLRSCFYIASSTIVREWCASSMSECSIPVNKSVFAAASSLSWFELVISYICITDVNNPRTAEASEGSELTISCSDKGLNSRINMLYADVRSKFEESCNDNDDCNEHSPVDIKELCASDSNDCSIPVNSRVFDYKGLPRFKLKVQYQCLPETPVWNADQTERMTDANDEQSTSTVTTKTTSGESEETEQSTYLTKINADHTAYTYEDEFIPHRRKRRLLRNAGVNSGESSFVGEAEGGVLDISCSGILVIVYAIILPSRNLRPCFIRETTSIVRQWCGQDRQNCSIPVKASVMGIPFSLKVHYSCTPDRCPKDNDTAWGISWLPTIVNSSDYQLCPGDKTGKCSRTCSVDSQGNPKWSIPNCDGCVDKRFNDILDQIRHVNKETDFCSKDMSKITKSLSNETRETLGLTVGNLNASLYAIVQLTTLREFCHENSSREEIMSVVQTISNLLQTKNEESWKTLQRVNRTVAAALMWSVEVYGSSLVLSLNQTDNYTTIREVAEHLVLEATTMEIGNLPSHIIFPSSETGQLLRERNDSLSLPTAALNMNQNENSSSFLRVWGSYYKYLESYLPGTDSASLNSRILSLSVYGLRRRQKLKEPITVTLHHNTTPVKKYTRHCVFWDYDASEGGNWNETGCKVKTSDSEHTVCICDHLTSFAVLMSTAPSIDTAINTISATGCIISVVALILTVVIYIVTWKEVKSDQAAVLMNLCVALIIGNVIFLAGADKVDPKTGCTLVSVLLHYFFLAAFFLMLAEGIELLLYIIFVFHVRSKTETTRLIVAAWVLPLIIVAISLGVTGATGYGSENLCWLSVENGLIWAFIGPVLVIIGVNLVILVVVIWKLITARLPSNRKQQTTKIRRMVWNISVISPIMGIAWIFGILSVSFHETVFQYIFVIANSFQGLFIFIFHALLHNQQITKNLSTILARMVSFGQRVRGQIIWKVPTEVNLIKEGKYNQIMELHDDGLVKQKSSVDTSNQQDSFPTTSTNILSSDQSNAKLETNSSSITVEVYKP